MAFWAGMGKAIPVPTRGNGGGAVDEAKIVAVRGSPAKPRRDRYARDGRGCAVWRAGGPFRTPARFSATPARGGGATRPLRGAGRGCAGSGRPRRGAGTPRRTAGPA